MALMCIVSQPIFAQSIRCSENTRTLCQAIPKVVSDLWLVGTDVHCESISICTKYLLLLNKFAECYQMLNGKIEFNDKKVEGFSKI